jgi:hypothetical protein
VVTVPKPKKKSVIIGVIFGLVLSMISIFVPKANKKIDKVIEVMEEIEKYEQYQKLILEGE